MAYKSEIVARTCSVSEVA